VQVTPVVGARRDRRLTTRGRRGGRLCAMNNSTSEVIRRLAAPAAMASSVALAVGGVIQITDEQSSESTIVGIEHVSVGALSLALVLLVPAVLRLASIAGRSRGATAACIGLAALSALMVVSNVRGNDPSFFAAVAVPANLLWFGGFVALAIALKRSGRVPAAVAIGLPVTWILCLPLSVVGGGIAAGAYWLTVGWMLRHERLERSTASAPLAVPA
jgi:hypothetical protein